MGPSDRDSLVPDRALTLALSFQCNNRCRICLVDSLRNTAQRMSFEQVKTYADENGQSKKYDRLILSGGEVTLDDGFLKCVQYAREKGGFRHIRVQSNGRTFKEASFLQACRSAGVDEYYVSVRAHDASLERQITGEKDSFGEMSAGLENISASGATLITNTPVFSINVPHLVPIVDFVATFRPARVEFYGFVPVRREQRDLMVSTSVLQHHLVEALARCSALGLDAGTSWVPRCILGEFDRTFSPEMSEPMICERFWRTFPSFSCFYARVCDHYPRCKGLPHPYVEDHGWELDVLRPAPRASHDSARAQPRSGRPDAQAWLDLLAGPDGKPAPKNAYWTLRSLDASPGRAMLRFTLPEGFAFDVTLERRGTRASALQTNSFDVAVEAAGRKPAPTALFNRFTSTLLAVIARNDDGRLAFND